MKRILQLLLIVVILCAFTVTGYASDYDESLESKNDISTRMTYIQATTCNLSISGAGYSTSSASMTAYAGTDKVRISMYLQQYDGGWSTLNHWTTESTVNTTISLSRNWYVSSGYNYRVLVYYYAYEGTQTESLSRTDTEWY